MPSMLQQQQKARTLLRSKRPNKLLQTRKLVENPRMLPRRLLRKLRRKQVEKLEANQKVNKNKNIKKNRTKCNQ